MALVGSETLLERGSEIVIASQIARQRDFFGTGRTLPVEFRLGRLRALLGALDRYEKPLLDALHADLGKPRQEAYVAEIGFVKSDIAYAMRRLPKWARSRRKRTPLISWPAQSRVYPEPYGVVLILGAWNYPVQLVLSPLVSALAAGNCAVIKPSELAPTTSGVLTELIRDTFAPEYVQAIAGGPEVAEALLAERFDYIFFTGSERIGRAVMRAASEHLTPVTLELGGKSPCIVWDDVDVKTTARRILWGKCMNAGQVCVAPDFVLARRPIYDALLGAMRDVLKEFYGDARRSEAFGRIVNQSHWDRLTAYLKQGRIYAGGQTDRESLFIEPTLLIDVDYDAPVMREEIFGPILPILPCDNLDDVIGMLKARPKPLALYVFAKANDVQQRVVRDLSAGGITINDTVLHILGKELPFGGVGSSGMGAYHGKHGFDTFTHYKSVVRRSMWPDPKLRYPSHALSLERMKQLCGFLLGR